MWESTRDVGITAGPAYGSPALKPVYMTVAWTYLTASKHLESPFHLLLKNVLVAFVGNQVGRCVIGTRNDPSRV